MKSLFLSLFVFSALTLAYAQANAAPLSCEEVDQAAAENAIFTQPFHSETLSEIKLQIELLKKAVVLSESLTQSEVNAMSFEQLVNDFDPIFNNIVIGKSVFHSVNLSLGDNPYVYLFDTKTGDYVDIMSADGSVMVGRDFCEASSDAF